jgi:hypothetical protein
MFHPIREAAAMPGFPNLWKYPGAEQYCRAIPREVSEDEYVRLVSAATQRTPEDVREILKQGKS